MPILLAAFAPLCQLLQVLHLIAGFLLLLLAFAGLALGFLMDVVTWFSLKLYDVYLPLFLQVWDFFAAGLSYQCS